MSAISTVLAQAGISIFAISTYNTDYILVKARDLEAALQTLTYAGYEIAFEAGASL
ncbi:ACT domain-containing protein [Sporomusa termitida]|uniref:ACT domain-containing protein n=1 Tax=Sporomusa termitida TaxID=2377 RepID=UPI001B8675DE